MSRKIPFRDFALACGVSQGAVNNWVNRGNLIEVDKCIDVSNETNALWIEKRKAKGKQFDLNRMYEIALPVPDKKEEIQEKAENEIIEEKKIDRKKEVSLKDVELKKKKLELEKLQKAIRLDEIRIQKAEGQLIPFKETVTLFIFAAETVNSTYLQNVDGIINIFVQRLGANHAQQVEIRKELREYIKNLQAEFKENLLTGLDGIVEEFTEVRGRGESKI